MRRFFLPNSILDFLTSAVALFCVGSLLIASSSFLFFGLPAYVFGFSVAVVFIGGYLAWQGLLRGASLPKSGLELPLIALVVALLFSLAFSANPRAGLERVAQLIALIVLFYIALDLFDVETFRAMARRAFLWVSGFIILFALLETYAWYLSWWSQVGSRTVLPPFQYRFISLAMHPSFFMMIVNMCAPLAIVSLAKAKSKAARFGSLLWLVMYLTATLFASSRAGWMGAAAWVFTLVVLRLRDGQSLNLLFNRVRQYKRKMLFFAVIVGGSVLLIAILLVYKVFAASNPAHGSGVSLNREMIWESAFTVIQSSPWWGSGPGQLSQNLLPASKASPFGFWPWHAHSTPLQILAEFGLVGFISFLLLIANGVFLGVQSYRKSSGYDRSWEWASIAALSSIAIQGIFDDVTYTFFPLTIIVFHAASLLHKDKPIQRFKHVSQVWLIIPSLIAAFITVLNIWSNMPYNRSVELAEAEDWSTAAQSIEQSIQRDPRQPAYLNQAGMIWSRLWQETGDFQALTNARGFLSKTTDIDPGNSLIWANLAVLDWNAKEYKLALSHIRIAIDLSPNESLYWLNYGFFLEQLGEQEEAMRQYQRFLAKSPSTISHPFWTSSSTRKQVLITAEDHLSKDIRLAHWQIALDAMNAKDFSAARRNLALSELYHENPMATSAGWAELARREGRIEEYHYYLEDVIESAEYYYWGVNNYPFKFSFRKSMFAVVPGFIKVTEDGGQFAALTELLQLQTKEHDCQAARRTWITLQRELRAGEGLQFQYPNPSACP